MTLSIIAVIVAATIAAAAYAARRIARPIGAVAEVARARASGSREARAEIAGPREVADVGVAFNALIDALLAPVHHPHRAPRAVRRRPPGARQRARAARR
jgi:methyl-accepting chemotaxis protein